MRMLRRIAVAALVLLGLAAGGAALGASPAGALSNPGPGMGCTSGTDDCSGWVASFDNPTCVAYNVYWTHYFLGAPNGDADYHVMIDQWWNGGPNCTAGGGAHLIGRAADIYVQDWEVPHVDTYAGSYGTLHFLGHYWTGGLGGSYNVTAWTPCHNAEDSGDAWVSYASYAGNTFTSGSQSITPNGISTSTAQHCNHGTPGGMAVDGSLIGWTHYTATVSNGTNHYITQLYLR